MPKFLQVKEESHRTISCSVLEEQLNMDKALQENANYDFVAKNFYITNNKSCSAIDDIGKFVQTTIDSFISSNSAAKKSFTIKLSKLLESLPYKL